MIDAPSRLFLAACVAATLWTHASVARARANDDRFGPDKPLHFTACALIAGFGYTLGASLDADPDLRFGLAFGLPLAAGFGKELFDAARGGSFSRGDLAWDLLGTMTGVTLSWLIGEVLLPRRARSSRASRAPRTSAALTFSWS